MRVFCFSLFNVVVNRISLCRKDLKSSNGNNYFLTIELLSWKTTISLINDENAVLM